MSACSIKLPIGRRQHSSYCKYVDFTDYIDCKVDGAKIEYLIEIINTLMYHKITTPVKPTLPYNQALERLFLFMKDNSKTNESTAKIHELFKMLFTHFSEEHLLEAVQSKFGSSFIELTFTRKTAAQILEEYLRIIHAYSTYNIQDHYPETILSQIVAYSITIAVCLCVEQVEQMIDMTNIVLHKLGCIIIDFLTDRCGQKNYTENPDNVVVRAWHRVCPQAKSISTRIETQVQLGPILKNVDPLFQPHLNHLLTMNYGEKERIITNYEILKQLGECTQNFPSVPRLFEILDDLIRPLSAAPGEYSETLLTVLESIIPESVLNNPAYGLTGGSDQAMDDQ